MRLVRRLRSTCYEVVADLSGSTEGLRTIFFVRLVQTVQFEIKY